MNIKSVKQYISKFFGIPSKPQPEGDRFIRVIIESRYRDSDPGRQEYFKEFAFACMEDCFRNYNEAGFASHCNYTKFLNEEIEEERNRGIIAGFAWREVAEKSVVYTNLGTSPGVEWGIQDSIKKGKPVEYRTLPPDLFNKFHEKYKHLLPDEKEQVNSSFFANKDDAGEFLNRMKKQ